jgi:hypothetical protein
MDDDTDGFTHAAFSFCPGCHAHRFPNFPQGFPAQGNKAWPAWWQNVFLTRIESSVRVKKMVLDTDIKGKFRRKTPNSPRLVVSMRRFRRLLADVQSSASSKLANPLINQ